MLCNGQDDARERERKRPFITTGNNSEEDEENSLVAQMQNKYFCEREDPEKDTANNDTLIIFGVSPLVAAHERMLELLVLDNLGITRIGDLERLASLAKNVTELDLSCNKLDWNSVGQLFGHLPNLRTLNVSHNAELGTRLVQRMPTAHKLRTLILIGLPSVCLVSLRNILLHSTPSLLELHLSRSHISAVDFAATSVDGPISVALKELHLNECAIDKWCTVLAWLRLFPRLNSLYLAENPISDVERVCECGHETEQLTPNLCSISLSNTKISSWEAIENLEAVEGLEELRVAHIPLLDQYPNEEKRHLVIGRLRALKVLNGSKIEPNAREESERFFIRYYADAEKRPLVYDQLIARHGMLEQLVQLDLTPKKFAKVILHCEETEWARMWIKLRLCGTVLGLMKFASVYTKIPLRAMRLFYVDKDVCETFGPMELRFPSQELKTLHVEDGDTFMVQSKIVLSPSSPSKRQQQAKRTGEQQRV